ncbi:sensor histidine kinase [Nocardioides sp. T2.26MG-1]|uniref:sensor histidine kinase n=1 Tax=Nocardioides sp. T2.26MG-1 TaxID=3041166 RepID=UPI0024778BE6|nr:PAS domain-containing sensor histidine kinase [Nocardioides sp. T2.26MG-1]CAI9408676.1 Adaptive-response sensory-kinase SasA [Nocardioides sp. T2.26MG-1]
MARSWIARVIVLLVPMTLVGVTAVQGAPDGGHAIGIWPVGLATGCLMVTSRPRTPLLVVLVAVLATGSIWVGGRDLDVAAGLGVGLSLGVWTMWRILAQGRRERAELRTSADLARFLGGGFAGASVVAAAAALTGLVTGWGDPGLLALAVGTSHLGAQLTVVPLFCRLRYHAPVASRGERIAQWVLIVTITPAVFLPQDSASIVFLVIPVLVWGAMRSSPYEALAQLLAVLAFAIPLTTWGHGPFANAGQSFELSADGQGILLATYGAVCALVVIPLVLTVGEQLEHARQSAAERDKVQNIVNGTTGVAIIGTDELGRVTLFNPGAERLLGYRAEEVLGRLTRQFHSDRAVVEKAAELGVAADFGVVAAALIGKGATDMRFLRKDGVERDHWMSLNRIKDDRGQVIGYVSTSEDITDRVEAEARLVESLETERQAVERLREVDQVKDAFVSSVSHELRTPITSILGYTEMLEDGVYGELMPAQLDALRRVAANSTRLLSLINDLLTLSRVQEDEIGFSDRVFDLRTIVSAGTTVVAPMLQRRALHLDLDLPDEPMPFLGDRDMLERVVINLVGNAIKFTPEGGRIAVRLRVAPDNPTHHIVLEVSDTGIGIPVQEQERLFSRFFRSSLAQEQAIPGSGLGLSIAHAIVEKHGGSMSVESAAGEGTTFRVHLPPLTAS